ncbi:hypothetical protein CCR95_14960 [Thiocystis minor]|uniref:ABC transporter ATP-binding protein n=1 Tax=Thiocystis minor TaxID=61597 RepID=UPI0019115BD1|nr:ABC transporter ATP-binding protein [Thiocystis minor]MBK5965350.1 hypothetical protein [Thiocystis minor]
MSMLRRESLSSKTWSPLLRRLLRDEVLPRRRSYLAAVLCMALAAAATAASAWLMRDVVNDIFVAKNADLLWLLSAAVAGIFVLKGLGEYGSRILLGRIGSSITASLRRRFYAQLLRQELRFFVEGNSSELVARLIHQIDAVKGAIELLAIGVARDLLTLAGLVLVMLSQQPLLFALALPGALLVVGFVRLLTAKLGAMVRQEHDADIKLISLVQETAQGIRSVKTFDLGPKLERDFAAVACQSEQRTNHILRINALPAPLSEALGGLAIAGVILYAGWMAIAAGTSPGEFMAFITALLLAYDPARRLSHLKLQLEQHLVLAEGFYRFMDRRPAMAPPSGRMTSLPLQRPLTIRLERVSFGYGTSDSPLISDLDLTISPGRITALCGPTGSGKSTLVDLLLRFHDPWSGRVTLDGHDIRELSPALLNALYAYVGQDLFLFDASIEENIRLGREDLDEARLAAAAQVAMLDDFIQTLPAGYATPVGEKGIRLSTGQRQRVAIARALVKGAPVLVLDEATSALDPATERGVLERLRRHSQRCSILLVSHRLAPIAAADQILVLEHGKIVEQGTYAALSASLGPFATLFGGVAPPTP